MVVLEAAVDAENAETSTGNKTNQVKKKTMKRKKDRTRGSMTENQRKRKLRLRKIDASVKTFLQGLKFIYVFIDRSILFYSAVLYNFFFSILFGIFEFLTKIESLVWCNRLRLSL